MPACGVQSTRSELAWWWGGGGIGRLHSHARCGITTWQVPVCRIGGVQVNDSPVILNRVLELAAERGDTTLGAIDDEQKKWMEWADRKLAVLLFPNITRSMTESMQAFSYIWDVPHFSTYDKILNRYGGAVAMRLAQGKIKKKCVSGFAAARSDMCDGFFTDRFKYFFVQVRHRRRATSVGCSGHGVGDGSFLGACERAFARSSGCSGNLRMHI